MNSIIATIKKRYRQVIIYNVALIVLVGFSVPTLLLIITAIKYFEWIGLFVTCGFCLIELLSIFLLLRNRRLLIEYGAKATKVTPFVIKSDCKSYDSIIALFESKNLQMIENGSYTYCERKSRRLLYVLLYADEYNKYYEKFKSKMIRKARQIHNFPDELPLNALGQNIRVSINCLQSFNEKSLSKAKTNAIYGMLYAEPQLDIYIDLSTGEILIPDCCTFHMGRYACYKYAINNITSILN